MNDPDQIQRLGFESWADNLIVNAFENMAFDQPFDHKTEDDDLTLVVRITGQDVAATVRAYVPGKGWLYHERTFKIKSRNAR
jgi:hypothetical protein